MTMQGVRQLSPLAISLVVLTMVVSVGGIMLTQFQPAAYDHIDVANETFNATSDPFNYTVAESTNDPNYVDLESAQAYESLSQSTTVTTEIVNSTTVEVSGLPASPETTLQSIEYTYNAEGTASGIIDQGLSAIETFGSFFTVIVVVGIGAVLLLLLQVFRSAGRNGQGTVA